MNGLGDNRHIDAVVIGGSAGALNVLKTLLPRLTGRHSVPTVVVVHVPPDRPNALAEVLAQSTDSVVKEAEDKERLALGTVYLAPPGYHLYVESDHTLALSTDEPEHFSRPAIDVLFESAADVFGERLVGIVLSGANQDGAAGLKAIGERGGVTVVQDPNCAEVALMPQAAIAARRPDAVLNLDQLVPFLAALKLAGGSDV